MQSQLQSFQSVRVTFGSQMDVERMLLSIVLFIICFVFVVIRAVFLDCAALFLVTGETLF